MFTLLNNHNNFKIQHPALDHSLAGFFFVSFVRYGADVGLSVHTYSTCKRHRLILTTIHNAVFQKLMTEHLRLMSSARDLPTYFCVISKL